jgi:hypothetical protein
MSCDRCEDIHQAQKAGLNDNECKCSCHDDNECTCQSNTTWTAPCPTHGWLVTGTTCTTDGGCWNLNLNNV